MKKMKLYNTPQIKIVCLMNEADCIRTSVNATKDPYGLDIYNLSDFNSEF